MSSLTRSSVIDCRPERVYDVLAEVERLTPEGSGTRVEIEVDYELPLGLLGKAVDSVYLHGKNEEQAEEILAKLKALCETS